MKCKNCFQEIDSSHKKVICSSCNTQLHKECAIKENNKYLCDVCYTVKEEDKEKEPIVIPEIIRRSHIETYRSCPYKFYLEIIKDITPSENNIYAQVGIDLHKLFEQASKNDNYVEKNMFESFNKIWNNYDSTRFNDEEQYNILQERSIMCIKNFYKVLPNLPTEPFSTEDTIVFNIGDNLPKVQTTSDRIDLVNDELEVIDWKTGKTMVGNKLSTDLQAPLYIYGIRQKYKLPIRKFTFHYLQDNKERTFERITNEDYVCRVKKREYYINITNAIREVQSIFSQINKNNFKIPYNTKKMYFACKMCFLQKEGYCKGADVQSWILCNKGE